MKQAKMFGTLKLDQPTYISDIEDTISHAKTGYWDSFDLSLPNDIRNAMRDMMELGRELKELAKTNTFVERELYPETFREVCQYCTVYKNYRDGKVDKYTDWQGQTDKLRKVTWVFGLNLHDAFVSYNAIDKSGLSKKNTQLLERVLFRLYYAKVQFERGDYEEKGKRIERNKIRDGFGLSYRELFAALLNKIRVDIKWNMVSKVKRWYKSNQPLLTYNWQ